jgi:hypothetical protein
MNSRPGSSQRMLVSSPPPSKALLSLQNQGLELPASPSSCSLLSAKHASARSTPSDLDKPLPLEPFDSRRRSSSVYSTDTTITNIIRMYGDYRDLDEVADLPPVPLIHQPQAYRDTVAPLLVKRLSLSRSPSPRPPTPPRPRPRASVSSISLRSTVKKTAPSFAEFSRNLQDRRNELVSPLSSASDHLHQAAYDQLFPPSTQVSSVNLAIAVAQTPPLPDAMSVTISDVAESELLPSPPDLRNISPPSPILNTPGQLSVLQQARSLTPFSSSESRQGYRSRHWSENWLEDDLRVDSPISEPPQMEDREYLIEKEQADIIPPTASKNPGIDPESLERKRSQRNSKRSSLQQGVNDLLRSLSISSRRDSRRARARGSGPRERQLAIQATPYQLYGDQIWSTKKAKKKSRDDKASHTRGKSMDLVTAYQSGQSQFVNVLESAKQRLTRRTSQRRRRKLKQSIIVVGPSQTASAINDKYGHGRFVATEDNRQWI